MSTGFEDDVSLSPSSPPASAKQEPDEDDRYEDALDLDTSQARSKVWLVRLPKYLMEQWEDIEYFGGHELGKVFIQQQGNKPWNVKLVLNDTPRTHDLPHSYDLTHQNIENTYLFKEQDLPKSAAPAPPTPNLEQSQFERYTPLQRAAPKRTALVGSACHECVVLPDFKDPNYSNVLAKRRKLEQPDSTRQVTLLEDTTGVGGSKYGATLRQQGRSIWQRQQQKRDLYRNGEGKAIRMPKDELLNKLFVLFEEVPHWTLKGLRDRTRQPEVYLRDVLDEIALLNKKGPNTAKYSLKQEFLGMKGEPVADMVTETASAAEEDEVSDINSDDNLEDMEL